jgi:hypothetical protein
MFHISETNVGDYSTTNRCYSICQHPNDVLQTIKLKVLETWIPITRRLLHSQTIYPVCMYGQLFYYVLLSFIYRSTSTRLIK